MFFLGLLGACDSDKVIKDMVEFDRAYVPALYYTSINDRENAVKSMIYLRMRWENFRSEYENSPDFTWKREFIKTGELMEKAGRAAGTGKNLMDAHDALEEIRYLLLEARRKNGITYIMDSMTDYHSSLGAVVSMVNKKEPGEITIKHAETIKELAGGMENIIEQVNK